MGTTLFECLLKGWLTCPSLRESMKSRGNLLALTCSHDHVHFRYTFLSSNYFIEVKMLLLLSKMKEKSSMCWDSSVFISHILFVKRGNVGGGSDRIKELVRLAVCHRHVRDRRGGSGREAELLMFKRNISADTLSEPDLSPFLAIFLISLFPSDITAPRRWIIHGIGKCAWMWERTRFIFPICRPDGGQLCHKGLHLKVNPNNILMLSMSPLWSMECSS